MPVPTSAFIYSTRGNLVQTVTQGHVQDRRLGRLGAAGLAIPLGNTVSGSSASLLPSAKMPKPFQTTFSRLEVLSPLSPRWTTRARWRTTTSPQSTGAVGIVPGMMTPVLGYDGLGAGAADRRQTGHPHCNDDAQQAARRASRPSAPRCTCRLICTGRRRCRSTTATPATSPPRAGQVLPVPEFPAGPHAVVPRPRRALHGAERLLRPGLSVPPARRHGAGAAARRASSTCAITLSDMMFAANGSQLYDDRDHSGLVG